MKGIKQVGTSWYVTEYQAHGEYEPISDPFDDRIAALDELGRIEREAMSAAFSRRIAQMPFHAERAASEAGERQR